MTNVTYIDKSKLETLGSEIRRLCGIEEKKTIAELTELVAHYQEDTGYIDGTITEAIDPLGELDSIRNSAFYSCASLQTASFAACTSIGSYAFMDCTSLQSISFPVCASIGSYAFQNCPSLQTASFPVCTNIGSSAFYYCTSLQTIDYYNCSTALINYNSALVGNSAILNVHSKIYDQVIASYSLSSRIGKLSITDEIDRKYVFPYEYNKEKITEVPEKKREAQLIGYAAFYSCSSLQSISFPVCASIGSSAFADCRSLRSISFPVCVSIGGSAFRNCYLLQSISFPVCTNIGNYAFYSCSSLQSISFPVCASIGNNAFWYCTSLQTISFPVCASIGSYAFCSCRSLQTVSFPVCTNIESYAFQSCRSLQTAFFPVCTSIGGNAFQYCYSLSALIIKTSNCALSTQVFDSTPMSNSTYLGYYGSIYVPQNYVSLYKTRTNWSAYADRITAIEGSPFEEVE